MNNSKTRIAVIGAGAIGSLIGALLAHAGEDVTLVARAPQVAAMQKQGLRIEGILGSLSIPVKAAETLNFHPDLVLLAVKTQDVESACEQIKDFMQGVPLLTLQNGVRSDEIAAGVLPRENIISGVVMLNAQYLEPGLVTYSRGGSLIIGEAFGTNGQRVKDIQSLLNQAIPTEISDNIRDVHWTKLLINNLSNGLEAMSGLPIRDCMRRPGLRKAGVLILKEGDQVIRQAGSHLAALPGVPMPAFKFMIQAPVPVASLTMGLLMGSLKTLSSTLQSLRRGRPTEIEYLNGEIVRLGRQIGIPTPYNARLVEIVKNIELDHQFLDPDEVERIFFSRNSKT